MVNGILCECSFILKRNRPCLGPPLRHRVSLEPSHLSAVGPRRYDAAVAAVFCTRGHPLLLNTVQINSSETAPLFTAHTCWPQTRRGYNEALTFVTSLEKELEEKYCAFCEAKTFVLALRRNAYFSVSLLWFFQRAEQSSTQRGFADCSTMTEAFQKRHSGIDPQSVIDPHTNQNLTPNAPWTLTPSLGASTP